MAKVTNKSEKVNVTKKAETVKSEKAVTETVKKEKFDSTALGESLKKMLENAGIPHKYTAPKNGKTAQFSSKGNVFCISKKGARVYLMEKTYNDLKDNPVLENVTTGHKSAQFAGATVSSTKFLQFVKALEKSYKAETVKKENSVKKENAAK